MASYWVKNPGWLKCFFPAGMVWDHSQHTADTVYITFDDGPHPQITPFVLDELKKYDAHATFFCVGNNVARYPDTYKTVLAAGHRTGNHTYNHLNGWKTTADHYIRNIHQAAKHIDSPLFRPPYGRIKLSQYHKLAKRGTGWKVYMWDILSGDFDNTITPQQCADNVIAHIVPGSIVVFHDSEKAWERLRHALPAVLQYCHSKGWRMAALP
ncbi:polysaccharide deacetylase family protein [Nemorincola caseinilytica]|uniref:Polysaccharide deacetylase family protein n=1 Tax=Nemorincola caseinilytica TaxID=2054315 RepID=A0ABP8N5B7_9BACT